MTPHLSKDAALAHALGLAMAKRELPDPFCYQLGYLDCAAELLPLLEIAMEALDKIKSSGGRAEVFGLELYRCPTCASAEIASEALAELEREMK